jgi:hypothetical protein
MPDAAMNVGDAMCEQVVPQVHLRDYVISGTAKMTRTRLVELTNIAKEIATAMDNKGIKQHETCLFGTLMQTMLQYK